MLKYVEPVWTGEILYRCLVPSERLPLSNGEKHPVLKRPVMVSSRSQLEYHASLTPDFICSIVESIKYVFSIRHLVVEGTQIPAYSISSAML